MTPLRIGFIPLSDCAVLAVADAKGFFRRHGLRTRGHFHTQNVHFAIQYQAENVPRHEMFRGTSPADRDVVNSVGGAVQQIQRSSR